MKKQLIAVAVISGAAQLAAFVKLWLVARYFGVGVELDGYNLAFVIPTLVSGVITGAIQTGLFPVYVALRTHQGNVAASELERVLFWLLLIVGLSISAALCASAGALSDLLAANGSPELRRATAYVLYFSAFTIGLNAIGDYLGYLLALRGRYVIAAAAPIANAIIGAMLLAAWPQGGLTILALSTLIGILLQVTIVLGSAHRLGFSAIGTMPKWARIRSPILEIARLGAWILPGTLFSNMTNALPPLLLVSFGGGAISAFGYAFRFHITAVQLLVMAVSPILLSKFSELVVSQSWSELERLQRYAFRISLAIGFLGMIAVALLGEQVLIWLFGHGRFDADAAERVAQHWLLLSAGLAAALYGNVLAKRMQAHRRARELSVIAGLGLLSMIVLVRALRSVMGELAVPASVAVVAIVTALLMSQLLRGRGIRTS